MKNSGRSSWHWLSVFLLCTLFVNVQAQHKIKVACVGNSITYGYGIGDREHHSYPAQLQQLLGEKYLVENFGKSGTTLLKKGHRPYINQAEYKKALLFSPDVTVIHLGINDTDPRDWPCFGDEFVSDYLQLIQTFRKSNPKMRIIISRITPIEPHHRRFLSGTRDAHEAIQQAIEKVAKMAHVELLDFYHPLKIHGEWFADAVHPNEKGYKLMADIVYKFVTGNYGGLQMSPMYSNHMILQRNKPIEISGIADNGTKVKVKLGDAFAERVASSNGRWSVTLPAMEAGGPYELSVTTKRQKKLFTDVMIGEVWLCSGQSNMEMPLKNTYGAKQELEKGGIKGLRIYNCRPYFVTNAERWSQSSCDSVNNMIYYKSTNWKDATPSLNADVSAVAYYFGKALLDSLKVPVGIICNPIGGSTAESWISHERLEKYFPEILFDWSNNEFIQPWVKKRAAENVGDNKQNKHPYQPSYLYDASSNVLQHFPIRGIVWYQGESNAHNVQAYEKLFKLWINDVRTYWKDEALPICFVQLSSLDRPTWNSFRNTQRLLSESLPHVGMVVSSDLGDSLNVHPIHKREIGERASRWALCNVYHRSIIPSGPIFQDAILANDTVVVSFKYASRLHSSDHLPIRTFELCGEDEVYYPAEALIRNGKVLLYSSKVTKPIIVRYGWQPYTRANLVNEANLPASTFMHFIEKDRR